MPPRATIIIPHYGDPVSVDALLRSLSPQVESPDFEVLVVDDASPSPYVCRTGARVLRRRVNGGFGSAVNTGAMAAAGEILLVLNSDTAVPTNFVAAMLEAASTHPGAVVAPRILRGDGEPEYSARRFPRTYHWAIEWLALFARVRHCDAWHRAVGHDLCSRELQSKRVDWVVGSVFALPRVLFLEAGGFDERFHMNSEEVDLQRRLAQRGVARWFVGHISCVHAGGGASGDSLERNRSVWQSRLQYADKWGGRGWVWRARCAVALATLINVPWRLGRLLLLRSGRPWMETRDEIALLRVSTHARLDASGTRCEDPDLVA